MQKIKKMEAMGIKMDLFGNSHLNKKRMKMIIILGKLSITNS
jgi:hypothetical protein